MGVQFDRLRYEVFQNLFLSPMNTGLLRPAVATTPTVYGIETTMDSFSVNVIWNFVATTPTVYGIETISISLTSGELSLPVATTPTVYGIETLQHNYSR